MTLNLKLNNKKLFLSFIIVGKKTQKRKENRKSIIYDYNYFCYFDSVNIYKKNKIKLTILYLLLLIDIQSFKIKKIKKEIVQP